MKPKIPRQELATVIRLFMFCLFAGSSYTLAKTAADSLFLSRIGSDRLSFGFLASGIATALFATLWVRVAKRVSIGRLLRITSSVLAVCYFVMWWILPMMPDSFSLHATVYVAAEIKGCLYAIIAVSSMNELLGSHSSRQSWATALLGFPVAAITVGSIVGFESSLFDADQWLLVGGITDFLVLSTGIGMKSPRNKRDRKQVKQIEAEDHELRAKRAAETLPLARYADAETFAVWFSILIAAKVIVMTLMAYNWKVSVNEYLGNDERLLAQFFGWFYAMAGAGTLMVQFFVTGRLLSDKSVIVPIMVLPVVLFLLAVMFVSGGAVGFGVAFIFYITTSAKAMDSWRRSTHDTAIHLLYTSIERTKRRGLIGRNHGLVKPVAEILAGVVLVVSTVWFQNIALIAAALVWVYATLAIIGIVNARRKFRLKKKILKKRKKRKKKENAAKSTENQIASSAEISSPLDS